LIFLGAGASAIFGLKTLQGLTKDLVKKMTEAGHGEDINDIKKALKRFDLTPDFENIYTTLEALVSPRRGIKASGPFAAYIAYKCGDFRKIKPHPNFSKILQDFKTFLYEECTITPEKLEEGKVAYDKLFSSVGDVTDEERYLSSTVGKTGATEVLPASETIVTTNYDMSMELYHAQRIADGFSTTKDRFIEEFNPTSFITEGSRGRWLIKLHGSIWQFYHKGRFCKSIIDPDQFPHRTLKIKER
jgi:hypothetical protein